MLFPGCLSEFSGPNLVILPRFFFSSFVFCDFYRSCCWYFCRFFFLVVVCRNSRTDLFDTIFLIFPRDFPGITLRVLSRISTGNCPRIVSVPFGISLIVAFGQVPRVLEGIFPRTFLKIFLRISYKIPCKKIRENMGKNPGEIFREISGSPVEEIVRKTGKPRDQKSGGDPGTKYWRNSRRNSANL